MSDDAGKNDAESLFLQEMAGVTPIKSDNRVRHRKKPLTAPRRRAEAETGFAAEDVFSMAEIVEDCPQILSFSRGGLQHRVLKNLRSGRQPVEHVLDLHGLTVDEARIELLDFLGECEAAGIRHVLIIHGKGFRSKDKPVIKPMLNRWLRASSQVLAFHSAQPKDGGSGAVYVLLKLNTGENDR